MEKRNTGLIVLIVILSLLVVGLGGFIVYDKVISNDEMEERNVENNNTDTNKEEQEKLNTEELKKLETYINKIENNAFILMNYSNPEYILTKNNVEILSYSINESDFSKNANKSQEKVIWSGHEAEVSTRVSSIDDLSLYIKEKTNYELSKDKIKTAFIGYFYEELNLYAYLMSDSMYEEHKIINGYRINNEFHIKLDDNSEVVLTYDNGKYYFYSCNSNQ